MESKIKYLMFVLVFFLLIANVSALDVLKPASFNKSYTIIQTCASCTYVNLTVSSVSGIIVSNKGMANNGSGTWIYDMTPIITSRHDVTGIGDINGVNTSFATFFEVTPSGKETSTGDSILYFLFSLFFFGIIVLVIFFIFAIPSENIKDDQGFETKILRIKYLRVILIVLLYGLMILLLNFLIGLATNYSALSMFEGIFSFIFLIMMKLAWVFTLIMVLWIFWMLVHDTNVYKQIDKTMNGWGVMDALNGR